MYNYYLEYIIISLDFPVIYVTATAFYRFSVKKCNCETQFICLWTTL